MAHLRCVGRPCLHPLFTFGVQCFLLQDSTEEAHVLNVALVQLFVVVKHLIKLTLEPRVRILVLLKVLLTIVQVVLGGLQNAASSLKSHQLSLLAVTNLQHH